jgi:hypothetical protein
MGVWAHARQPWTPPGGSRTWLVCWAYDDGGGGTGHTWCGAGSCRRGTARDGGSALEHAVARVAPTSVQADPPGGVSSVRVPFVSTPAVCWYSRVRWLMHER